jgi:peroxiredoxin/outer membrane lipoprotein-sorting protein
MRAPIFLCLILPALGYCESDQAALAILERTAKTYREIGSYQIEIRSLYTLDDAGQTKVSESRIVAAGGGPGKFRWEVFGPGPRELRISDDRKFWVYRADSGQYTTADAGPITPFISFQQIDQNVSSASIAREETLRIGGKPVDCYVIHVERRQWPEGSDPATRFAMYRIDKKSFVVHKQVEYCDHSAHTMLYTFLKWSEAVPEDLFVFQPPAGSKQVAAFDAHGGVSLDAATQVTGSQAPDFSLKDVDGRSVDLRSLAGKAVVVDFWATWCPPCREEMPHLEQLHRQLREKGLVVLGLDVGEDADTVREFARKNDYTFTLLLGAEPDVSARYHVDGYPTVFVIDRAGKIAARLGGSAQESDLRAAVESALASR